MTTTLYVCVKCGRQLSSSQALARHDERMHRGTVVPLECGGHIEVRMDVRPAELSTDDLDWVHGFLRRIAEYREASESGPA